METRININYTPSKTSEVFGLFTLSFQGSDGKIHSVNTKFNPKQLWEFSRDTSSVAFDLLVLSMIVYFNCFIGNGLAGNGLPVILRCYQPILYSPFICNFKFADCLGTNVNVRNSLDYLDVFNVLTSSHSQQ